MSVKCLHSGKQFSVISTIYQNLAKLKKENLMHVHRIVQLQPITWYLSIVLDRLGEEGQGSSVKLFFFPLPHFIFRHLALWFAIHDKTTMMLMLKHRIVIVLHSHCNSLPTRKLHVARRFAHAHQSLGPPPHTQKMDTKAIALFIAISCMIGVDGDSKGSKLQIGVKKRVENCTTKTRKGDRLEMHYTVSHAHFIVIIINS